MASHPYTITCTFAIPLTPPYRSASNLRALLGQAPRKIEKDPLLRLACDFFQDFNAEVSAEEAVHRGDVSGVSKKDQAATGGGQQGRDWLPPGAIVR
jgi:hypothetical protein